MTAARIGISLTIRVTGKMTLGHRADLSRESLRWH